MFTIKIELRLDDSGRASFVGSGPFIDAMNLIFARALAGEVDHANETR